MRRHSTPPLDLVPVMGLASLLIPLLLLGQGVSFAAIDVSAPAMCDCHGGEDHPDLVPTVLVTSGGLTVSTEDGERSFEGSDLEGMGHYLAELRAGHRSSGRMTLVAEADVEYERLILAMDASRPHFPEVVVAGGVQ
ncbi:MAG: hypothetical protein H6737_09155 [Alphaproteobacteria bacterium]|nr:hypothetical protein [Alphaproteobacteria bacterium]